MLAALGGFVWVVVIVIVVLAVAWYFMRGRGTV
jgi:hypothetical protein